MFPLLLPPLYILCQMFIPKCVCVEVGDEEARRRRSACWKVVVNGGTSLGLRIIAPSPSCGSAVDCQILIFSYSNFIVLRVSTDSSVQFLGNGPTGTSGSPPAHSKGFFSLALTESKLPFTVLFWGRVSFQ